MKFIPRGAYSAVIQMWLESENGRIEIAQLGPDFIISRCAAARPEVTTGELVVQIDGSEKRRRVRLPDGMQDRETRTQIESLNNLPRAPS